MTRKFPTIKSSKMANHIMIAKRNLLSQTTNLKNKKIASETIFFTQPPCLVHPSWSGQRPHPINWSGQRMCPDWSGSERTVPYDVVTHTVSMCYHGVQTGPH